MFYYFLYDSKAWLDKQIYLTLEEARESALNLMDRPAWETTTTIRICRIDTETQLIDDVEQVIHGEHRAEAHKVDYL